MGILRKIAEKISTAPADPQAAKHLAQLGRWHVPLNRYWLKANNWLHAILQKLSMRGSKDAEGARFYFLGWVAVIGFPLYGWIWKVVYPQPYESPGLRVVGVLAAAPLLLARRHHEARWFAIYFPIAMTFMAPFFFVFMYLMNDGSTVWAQSLLIALVVLFHFDGKLIWISFVCGTTLAYLAFVLQTRHVGWPDTAIMVNVPIVLFAIVLVSFTKISRRIVQEEKLAGMATVLALVAHEMRTPLISVIASAKGLQRYVPPLIKVYRQFQDQVDADGVVPPSRLETTLSAIERIKHEVVYMNAILDLLLVNTTPKRDDIDAIQRIDIAQLVRDTLAAYPFERDEQRSFVSCSLEPSFMIEADENLCRMVLVNLLKNALRAIARARKGSILIKTEIGPFGPCLIVHDSGCGIASKNLPNIFNRFWSYPPTEGTGIGLAFCRETLARWDAEISCRSKEGEYTEFVLQFKTVRP